MTAEDTPQGRMAASIANARRLHEEAPYADEVAAEEAAEDTSPPWLSPEGQAFVEISDEMSRQLATWGLQNHDPFAYLAILTEEVGEAAQAAVKARFESGVLDRLDEELVQVAAVAVSALLCLRRGEWRWGRPGIEIHEGVPDCSRPPEELHARALELALVGLSEDSQSSAAWLRASQVLEKVARERVARDRVELPF